MMMTIPVYPFLRPNDDKMFFPLAERDMATVYYHGTSSFFSDAIETKGFPVSQPYISEEELHRLGLIRDGYPAIELDCIDALIGVKGVSLTTNARFALSYAHGEKMKKSRFYSLLKGAELGLTIVADQAEKNFLFKIK